MTQTETLRTTAAASPATPTRVAIVGATGYAGQELVRLVVRHPNARLTMATGSQATSAPRRLPALARIWDGDVVPLDVEAVGRAADIVFLALPEAASADVAPALLSAGARVIDLSGAFRLRDDAARAKWYPATKTLPAGVVYGLTEFTAAEIPGAALVSCPGCYPTASLLALQPLAECGLLRADRDVIVDAKSGVSGAGKAPSERTHFCENHGSVAAYGLFGHRHTPEIAQALGRDVTFTPHLVPLDRGLLSTMYARLVPGTTAARVSEVLEAAHATSPFVRLTGDALPEIKHVAWSNFCDIGWRVDEASGRIILVSAIDNLLKGAAGQAVQNFNLLVGIDERTGLP
jgi:N-acetyl-gamma-glutamyl-phosphate reductase